MECHFFARFRAHYGFDLRICNPHAGHEKGNVENKVGYVRRNYFVPVPHYTDSERFNRDFLTECESYALETHYEKGELVGELFQEELQKMRALPKHSFDVCEYMNRTANSYGQVRVDGHYYASRTEDAGRDLLIRLRAREVTIFSPNGSEIASYKRQYEGKASRNVLPELSLKHLSRHPGAWGNSQLRASLNEALRKQLDDLDASTRREILKTLSHLLEEHSFQTLLEALEGVLNREHLDVNAISVLAARIEDGEINMTVNSQGRIVRAKLCGRKAKSHFIWTSRHRKNTHGCSIGSYGLPDGHECPFLHGCWPSHQIGRALPQWQVRETEQGAVKAGFTYS